MNTWLHIRTFIALFCTAVGIAMIFGPLGNDGRLIAGSFLVAVGLTFLLSFYVALRQT